MKMQRNVKNMKTKNKPEGPKEWEAATSPSRTEERRSRCKIPAKPRWNLLLGAAGDHLEAAGAHLEPKIEYFIGIYYKSSHRAPKTTVFTCFCQLGTPKSHDYPIIYISYSTFWKRQKTSIFTCFCAKAENIIIYTTLEYPSEAISLVGPDLGA